MKTQLLCSKKLALLLPAFLFCSLVYSQTFTNEFHDFNDNQVPAGWTFYASNATLSGGYIGAYVSSGDGQLTKTGVMPGCTDSVVIEWEGSIRYNYWGCRTLLEVSLGDTLFDFWHEYKEYFWGNTNKSFIHFPNNNITVSTHTVAADFSDFHYKVVFTHDSIYFQTRRISDNVMVQNHGIDPLALYPNYELDSISQIKFYCQAATNNSIWLDNISIQFYQKTPYTGSETVTVCSGESYTFPDGYFESNITGTVNHTSILQGQFGCDSTINTTVNVLPSYNLTENIFICSGSDYLYPDGFSQTNITAPTNHVSNLVAINGCDSIITTNINIYSEYNLSESFSVCSGASYTYPDGTSSTNILSPESHVSNLTTMNGCDSIITTTISVNPVYALTENFVICSGDSYTYPDGSSETNITSSTSHVSNLTTIEGCDSVITTNLSVMPVYNFSENANVCSGNNFLFPDGTLATNISADMTHVSNLTSISGCDSTITTNITVVSDPVVTINFATSAFCENDGIISLVSNASPAGGFWSGTGVNTGLSTFDPSLAGSGTHALTYTYYNSDGCMGSSSSPVEVFEIPQLFISTTDAGCGEENGTASVSISGGASPYEIYWTTGETTTSIDSLAAGTYLVTVTDDNNCQASYPAMVSSTGISISGTVTPVTCVGGNDGAIDVVITASSGVQSIQWLSGQTSEDISGLTSGYYEVTAVSNNGCTAVAMFEVSASSSFSFANSSVNATCGLNDGSASCNVSGGSAPYSYQWFESVSGLPVGINSANLTGVEAGAYHVLITDDNGCSAIQNIVINNAGGPEIIINSIIPSTCLNDGAVAISIQSDFVISTVLWSNGETTQNISGLSPGYYSVEVTDENGCVGMAGAEVNSLVPEFIPICLVTVDTLTNTNLLVWEKPASTDIDYFNIYRETSVAGIYQWVASVPYTNESVYSDPFASPAVRSWRYKISAVNTCGEESMLSDFHKTIHLTIDLGIGNTINLHWDEYVGFAFGTYDLYRYTNANGWELIQSLPSTNFSYTDNPSPMGGLDYFISVTPPATCTSSNKVQDHNSSRSNKTSSVIGDYFGFEENVSAGLSIYPNPTNNLVTIQGNEEITEIIVYDMSGQEVYRAQPNNNNYTFNCAYYADGIYTVKVKTTSGFSISKLIKQ